jgi:hypothetical protein
MGHTSNRKAFNEAEYFGCESGAFEAHPDEIRSMVRRQLVGSVAIAIAIAVIAGLAALRPAPRDVADVASHSFAVIQQPAFAISAGQFVATMKQ